MSLWAQRKQFTYISVFLLIVVVILSVPFYYYFIRHQDTCFDGIQNQNEEGIDCGGICTKVCTLSSQAPLVHWQRFFRVTDGVYSAAAEVENPNVNVYAESVPYRFRFYDDNGVMIAERTGNTFMLPNTIFPIFESGIQTGQRTPIRVSFEFLSNTIDWQKKPYQLPRLVIIDQTLASSTSASATSSAKIEATIQNQSDFSATNIEVVALVFDVNDNAIASSHTVVDQIGARSATKVTFTWPTAFSVPVSKIEIVPKVLPRFNQ
ncbi:MAG: hypothetical protein WCI52_04220 [bacterium]